MTKEKEDEMIDNFLIEKKEEKNKLILDFAKQIIALEIEIKEIKNDIKEAKKNAKESGILVKEIMAAISELKKEVKEINEDTNKKDTIKKILKNDKEFLQNLETLLS